MPTLIKIKLPLKNTGSRVELLGLASFLPLKLPAGLDAPGRDVQPMMLHVHPCPGKS